MARPWAGRERLQRNQVIDLRTYRGQDQTDGSGADAPLDDLPAGTSLLHGQYTITQYLNSGGFGITYRAKDSLGRPVVIKECFPAIMCLRKGTNVVPRNADCAEELRKMIGHFVTEAHSLAALQHKNIVHVHQVFEENNTAYMAIDFIDGLDLLELIERSPDAMTPEEVVRITKRMLPAIKYVHDSEMLHRDISPDNILIDETGEPILIDFGAARKKAKTSSRAFSKMKFVKDGYSPQEFYIEGAEQGPYSDLYSFAATLYHAISGAAPEDGQKRLSALAQKEDDPYKPLAGRFPGYPRGFLSAIDDALIIVPHKRLQSADEWIARLQATPKRGPKPRMMPTHAARTQAPSRVASTPQIIAAEADVRASLAQTTPAKRQSRAGVLLGGLAALALAGGVFALLPSPGDQPAEVFTEANRPSPVAEPATMPALPALPEVTPHSSDLARDGVLALKPIATLPTDAKTLDAAVDALTAARPALALPQPGPDIDLIVVPADFAFALNSAETTPGQLPAVSAPRIAEAPAALSDVTPGSAFVADTAPPEPAAVVEAQASDLPAVSAHWDVEMPFNSATLKARNANTIEVNEITDADMASRSGDWLVPGAVIYAFNGEKLEDGLDLSGHVLRSLQVDPDGIARATVRYRAPDTGRIERGLLAVPVLRRITLADGTILEARVEDMVWVTRVTDPGTAGLAVGDRLISEAISGIDISTEVGVETVIEGLVAAGHSTAEFSVERAGDLRKVSLPLASSGQESRQ